MSRQAFRLTIFTCFLFSILLRYSIPPNPRYGAVHDDQLMVNLAYQIKSGNWLGDYEILGHLTHSKPPGYPMFLAFTRFLPWAPTVTTHLMILGGAFLFAIELRRLGASRVVVSVFFFVVCFFPSFFGGEISRVYREGFLTGLTFLVIGIGTRLGTRLSSPDALQDGKRTSFLELLFLGFTLGLCMGWAVITKPSWYSIGVLGIATAFRAVFLHGWSRIRSILPKLGIVIVSLMLGLSSLITYVLIKNHQNYDVAVVDTYASGGFAEALNTWASVESDSSRPYVLVDASQRLKVYQVSPTARLLEPYLEYAPGVGWRGASCNSPIQICDESTAWFPWELRDAVEKAGLGETPKNFTNTLTSLATEIDAACQNQEILCGAKGLAPGVLPLDAIPWRVTFDAFASGLGVLLSTPIGNLTRGPYTGVSDVELRVWSEVVRGLPDSTYEAVYRPESVFLGNTVLLLTRIFSVVWVPILLFGAVGVFRAPIRRELSQHLRWLHVACTASILISIAQLALLEASSGVYMSIGAPLYLLPVYPALICMATCGWSNFGFGMKASS